MNGSVESTVGKLTRSRLSLVHRCHKHLQVRVTNPSPPDEHLQNLPLICITHLPSNPLLPRPPLHRFCSPSSPTSKYPLRLQPKTSGNLHIPSPHLPLLSSTGPCTIQNKPFRPAPLQLCRSHQTSFQHPQPQCKSIDIPGCYPQSDTVDGGDG